MNKRARDVIGGKYDVKRTEVIISLNKRDVDIFGKFNGGGLFMGWMEQRKYIVTENVKIIL
jgi:hypothetical protein